MSSNTYTLKIDIDDSKIRELERRLMAVMGGKTAGLSGVASAATGKGGDKSALMANIGNLGAIAIGVATLVGLVHKLTGMIVDSSPMLKGMLKLLNYSVMLILRPIGDFIGFFLRPLIIYFLRSVALPFYKQMRPIMQALGARLGMQFMQRNEYAESQGGKAVWEEGFNAEEGMKNFKSNWLGWASLFDIFDESEFQTEETKKSIANMESWWLSVSEATIPVIDFSSFQPKINTAIEAIDFSIDLSGIQTPITNAINAIEDINFSEILTDIETKFSTLIDDIINSILTAINPFDNGNNNNSSTQSPTVSDNGIIIQSNNNNGRQPDKDPISAFGEWVQGGINEQLKGWGF